MDIKLRGKPVAQAGFVVERRHAASHLGTGKVAVFSTPAMIAFMERTCRTAADRQLPNGYITVGVKVCVSHLAAAPVGAKITIKARLEAQNGRKLLFAVEAWWDGKKIGEGEHERFIVHRQRFLERLQQHM